MLDGREISHKIAERRCNIEHDIGRQAKEEQDEGYRAGQGRGAAGSGAGATGCADVA